MWTRFEDDYVKIIKHVKIIKPVNHIITCSYQLGTAVEAVNTVEITTKLYTTTISSYMRVVAVARDVYM